jgi:hypothetical protein
MKTDHKKSFPLSYFIYTSSCPPKLCQCFQHTAEWAADPRTAEEGSGGLANTAHLCHHI